MSLAQFAGAGGSSAGRETLTRYANLHGVVRGWGELLRSARRASFFAHQLLTMSLP